MQYIAYFLITVSAFVCAALVVFLILLLWFMIKHRNDFTNNEDW